MIFHFSVLFRKKGVKEKLSVLISKQIETSLEIKSSTGNFTNSLGLCTQAIAIRDKTVLVVFLLKDVCSKITIKLQLSFIYILKLCIDLPNILN